DNIRAAFAWAVTAGETEVALRFAGALVRFWSTRGLMREGRGRLAEALAAAGSVALAILAKAHFASGYAALGEGDFREARLDFERSRELASEASDERAEGAALAQLAWLAMAAGEAESARELAGQSAALALARAVKDTWISSLALGNLARVRLCAADDPALARQLLAEALWLARERNDRRIAAEWIGTLAAERALEGRTADAARFCACAE